MVVGGGVATLVCFECAVFVLGLIKWAFEFTAEWRLMKL